MIVHEKSETLSAVAYFMGRKGDIAICRLLKVLDAICLYALNEANPHESELAAVNARCFTYISNMAATTDEAEASTTCNASTATDRDTDNNPWPY